MTISIVALSAADRQRMFAVDQAAFFFDPSWQRIEVATRGLDWARTFGACVQGCNELAGVYTSFDMTLSVPGPLDALAPVAGAACTLLFSVPPGALLLYLAFFAGFLLYIGAADVLPAILGG